MKQFQSWIEAIFESPPKLFGAIAALSAAITSVIVALSNNVYRSFLIGGSVLLIMLWFWSFYIASKKRIDRSNPIGASRQPSFGNWRYVGWAGIGLVTITAVSLVAWIFQTATSPGTYPYRAFYGTKTVAQAAEIAHINYVYWNIGKKG